MQLATIGGGMMGEALIRGLLRDGSVVSASDMLVAEPVAARRQLLEERYSIRTTESNREALEHADVAIMAVKPQVFAHVAEGLTGALRPDRLLISIMAGVPLDDVVTRMRHESTVRVMPNVMCQVGQGVLVWTAAHTVTGDQRHLARQLFAATGAEFEVQDEHYLDMATAVSASSPAFVFLMLEALIDAGVHVGFARPEATTLAVQTMLGAALLTKESQRHPAELKNTVTSPAGTTAEGLLVLERAGVRAAIIDAVMASYLKAGAMRQSQ